MKYLLQIFILFFTASCYDYAFSPKNDIKRIENIFNINIIKPYDILEDNTMYPIKNNIFHTTIFKFNDEDYKTIYNQIINNLNTQNENIKCFENKELDIIGCEIESNNKKESIYINTRKKEVYYSLKK